MFTSPNVRLIEFKNVGESGVKVAKKAIKAKAFAAAADAALGAGQNITVIYRENRPAKLLTSLMLRHSLMP